MDKYRVISVVLLNKKRYKILLEGTSNLTIALYPSEVRRFGIKEGTFISEEHYAQIEDILYKRGKERALYYLKDSDKTSYQMKTKLKAGFYPDEIIDRILAFLIKYGYIDDYEYAKRFISYNISKKSILRIKESLYVKGVGRDIIEDAIENFREDGLHNNCYGDENVDNPQVAIIRKHISKKIKADMDNQYESKIIMSLLRKGFMYEDIVNVLQEVKNTIFCG